MNLRAAFHIGLKSGIVQRLGARNRSVQCAIDISRILVLRALLYPDGAILEIWVTERMLYLSATAWVVARFYVTQIIRFHCSFTPTGTALKIACQWCPY